MNHIHLADLQEREIVPGYWARFVHSEHMTLAYWNVMANAALPQHSHLHEQITNVISGKFVLTVDNEVRHLEAGDVVVIPSGVSHSGKAVSDCFLIDAFYPVREEYRSHSG